MYKIFLYHQWQYEKAENYLEKMEADGYRLLDVHFSFLFRFKKATPRRTKYVFLYHYIKDYDLSHYSVKEYLCGSCKAIQVCGSKYFEPEVYRITLPDVDLKPILRFRNRYLKRVFLIKIGTASLFVVPTLLLIILGCWPHSGINAIFLLTTTVIATVIIIYYLTGLIALRMGRFG